LDYPPILNITDILFSVSIQYSANVAAAGWKLTTEDKIEIDKIFW